MNLKIAFVVIAAVLVTLYAVWKGGYESALEDVRHGNVQAYRVMN